MFALIFQSGIFGMIIALLILAALYYSIFSVKLIFFTKEPDYANVKNKIDNILRIGVLSMALGFLGTITGGYNAISAIKEAKDVSMTIVWEGVMVALSSTMLGLNVFVFSAVVWFILHSKIYRKL